MDPSVKTALDEILKRLDGMDVRRERRCLAERSSMRGRRTTQPSPIASPSFRSTVSFKQKRCRLPKDGPSTLRGRVSELEGAARDIELERFTEICDERDPYSTYIQLRTRNLVMTSPRLAKGFNGRQTSILVLLSQGHRTLYVLHRQIVSWTQMCLRLVVRYLDVLQEVRDLCKDTFPEGQQEEPAESSTPGQLFMMLSVAALSNTNAPCTIQFVETVLGKEVLNLVDYGSKHSISSSIATSLPGVQLLVTAA